VVTGHLAVFQRDEEKLARTHSLLHQRAKASLDSRLQARRVLRSTAIFAKWDAADVEAVVKRMDTRTFPPGSRICSEGDPHADEFYIITRGRVRVHQRRPKSPENVDDFSLPFRDGGGLGGGGRGGGGESKGFKEDGEKEIRVLGALESFGLAALTCGPSGATRTASCSAVDTVETLVLCHSDFEEELVKLEAKSRTVASTVVEKSDDNEEGNGGTASAGVAKESPQGRRRSSVRDVLASLAGDQIEELRKEDERRWADAKASVAAGGIPMPPRRSLGGSGDDDIESSSGDDVVEIEAGDY
jgi:CRP-like cAMP-binding protein